MIETSEDKLQMRVAPGQPAASIRSPQDALSKPPPRSTSSGTSHSALHPLSTRPDTALLGPKTEGVPCPSNHLLASLPLSPSTHSDRLRHSFNSLASLNLSSVPATICEESEPGSPVSPGFDPTSQEQARIESIYLLFDPKRVSVGQRLKSSLQAQKQQKMAFTHSDSSSSRCGPSSPVAAFREDVVSSGTESEQQSFVLRDSETNWLQNLQGSPRASTLRARPQHHQDSLEGGRTTGNDVGGTTSSHGHEAALHSVIRYPPRTSSATLSSEASFRNECVVPIAIPDTGQGVADIRQSSQRKHWSQIISKADGRTRARVQSLSFRLKSTGQTLSRSAPSSHGPQALEARSVDATFTSQKTAEPGLLNGTADNDGKAWLNARPRSKQHADPLVKHQIPPLRAQVASVSPNQTRRDRRLAKLKRLAGDQPDGVSATPTSQCPARQSLGLIADPNLVHETWYDLLKTRSAAAMTANDSSDPCISALSSRPSEVISLTAPEDVNSASRRSLSAKQSLPLRASAVSTEVAFSSASVKVKTSMPRRRRRAKRSASTQRAGGESWRKRLSSSPESGAERLPAPHPARNSVQIGDAPDLVADLSKDDDAGSDASVEQRLRAREISRRMLEGHKALAVSLERTVPQRVESYFARRLEPDWTNNRRRSVGNPRNTPSPRRASMIDKGSGGSRGAGEIDYGGGTD